MKGVMTGEKIAFNQSGNAAVDDVGPVGMCLGG
jgi:hypothetical protein